MKQGVRNGSKYIGIQTVLLIVDCVLGYEKQVWAAFLVVLLMLAVNIWYGIRYIEKSFIFLLFQGTFFLFTLSRGVGGLYFKWDCFKTFTYPVAAKALLIEGIALFGLLFGAVLCSCPSTVREDSQARKDRFSLDVSLLRTIFFIALCITTVFFFWQELDKFLYMRGKEYAEFYVSYQSRLPAVGGILANCYPFAMLGYVCVEKSRWRLIIAWTLYILSAVPILCIGSRNPIMLKATLCLLFVLWENQYRIRSLISKENIIIVAFFSVILILGLGSYNYIRDKKSITLSPMDLGFDFLLKQGTTFDTIEQGIKYEHLLPNNDGFYVFNEVEQELFSNRITRRIFHREDYGYNNSLKKGTKGKNFAHHISYIVFPDEYLVGHGRGTSYLIEAYVDFGFFGVLLISILFGYILIGFTVWYHNNLLLQYVSLMCCSKILFVPRDNAFSWLTPFLCISFIAFIVIIGATYVVGRMCKKRIERI